tara:strand:+ start:866 stop:2239 length:1374 start_codon:yes stop_codon:yes gene_type:complete
MNWNLIEIYKALNIKIKIQKNYEFNGISIDSRKIKKNNLFIPIKGNNFNGHKFINDVERNGVKACLIEKKESQSIESKKILKIIVKDTKEALIKLAEYARERSKLTSFICITGSSGKTTLKEWTQIILKGDYKSYCNPGNFNNDIGMPLALVNMPKDIKYCILELGMNNYGEIRKLVKIAKPHISIITNIGNAHIGNFKNAEDIANEKSKIFEYLNPKSSAIIPFESKYFKKILYKAKKKTNNIYTFGLSKICYAKYEKEKGKFIFSIGKEKLLLRKLNFFKYWEQNVLIILSLLKILNLNLDKFIRKLEKIQPLLGRGQLLHIKYNKKKFFLIDESYNSNPTTLKEVILNLKGKKKFKKKILVIGDMLELGKYSERMHKDIVKPILKISPDLVITVGHYSKVINKGISKEIETYHFDNYVQVYERIIEVIDDNDIVMIKGSNSIKLSKVCEKLMQK